MESAMTAITSALLVLRNDPTMQQEAAMTIGGLLPICFACRAPMVWQITTLSFDGRTAMVG